MCPISKTTFKEWQAEQFKDPEFSAIARDLEPGYQIARLRIARGLTQAQLAGLVGTHQPSIARIGMERVYPVYHFLNA